MHTTFESVLTVFAKKLSKYFGACRNYSLQIWRVYWDTWYSSLLAYGLHGDYVCLTTVCKAVTPVSDKTYLKTIWFVCFDAAQRFQSLHLVWLASVWLQGLEELYSWICEYTLRAKKVAP